MNCQGCVNVIESSNTLKCKACKAVFCPECLNISSDNLQNLSVEQLSSLKCPSCTNITRRKINDSTPVRNKQHTKSPVKATGTPNIVTQDSSALISSISVLLDEKLSPSSTLMKNLRDALKEDVKTMITCEINSVIKNLQDEFTATTDFISAEQRDLKSSIADKDKIIKCLQADQLRLQSELNDTYSRIESLEKLSREHNIELQAVPERKSENLLHLFQNLCKFLNVNILDNEVKACKRVAKIDASSKRPRNIVITLSSPRLRDVLLSAVTRYNKANRNNMINSSHIGLSGDTTTRIFLSEHLSPRCRQLHHAARMFCKKHEYKYVWVKYGQVFIRKCDDSNVIRIKNVDCLGSLEKSDN